MEKGNYIRLFIFIVLGLLLGGILGEVLGNVLGQIGVISGGGMDNPVRSFFMSSFEFGWGIQETGTDSNGKPIYQADVLNLGLIMFPIAFKIKLNVVSVLGLLAGLYIMKWSK
jgi:hypothetical protein